MTTEEQPKPSVNRFTATVVGECPKCGKRAQRQRSSNNIRDLDPMLKGDVAPVYHKRCEPKSWGEGYEPADELGAAAELPAEEPRGR